MAAVSNNSSLIIYPETEQLSPDIIAQRCKKIPEISNTIHPFYVRIKGIMYYCIACITYNQLYNISMFTQNSYVRSYEFLTIHASGDGEVINSRSSPKMLPGFNNALDSIMYISTCMHKMLGIVDRTFLDIASGKCDTQPYDKYYEYNLFSYRLFSIDEKTNQLYSLDNLSIYYKYFKQRNGSLTDTLIRVLEANPELTTKMNKLRELTYEFDGKEQKITDYFKSLNNLRKLPECYNYAQIINSMHHNLLKSNLLYKEFYYVMVNFVITNTDCIYYNDIVAAAGATSAATNAAAQPGGGRYTKKRRYHKKHRQNTRK